MNYDELERLYYITNNPQYKVLQALIDIETERDELYWMNDKLQREVDSFDIEVWR